MTPPSAAAAATVRGMEDGDHRVALGYPLIVGDGRRAPVAPRRRVQDSSLDNNTCCSSCKKALLGFVFTVVFVLLTEILLIMVLQSAPSPLIVLMSAPVVALGFAAAVVGWMAISVSCH